MMHDTQHTHNTLTLAHTDKIKYHIFILLTRCNSIYIIYVIWLFEMIILYTHERIAIFSVQRIPRWWCFCFCLGVSFSCNHLICVNEIYVRSNWKYSLKAIKNACYFCAFLIIFWEWMIKGGEGGGGGSERKRDCVMGLRGK